MSASATAAGSLRDRLESVADKTLLALRPYATAGHARFDLPGPASRAGELSDGLEAFARSFLAAGFRLSAAVQDDHDHAGWYAAGLAAGTDPGSGEAWPRLDQIAQTRVEAAAVAIGLHESRRWIWDHLDSGVQERVIDWLSGSSTERYPPSNWLWFSNVAQAFLRSVGAPYDARRIEQNIDYLDSCYLGDGWYSDGQGGSIDWYNGWVMHLFSLWYCRMSEGEPGIDDLLVRYRARLRDYLGSAALLFGGDGAPLFQGRSLIYRYATVGAPWAGVIFEASPLPAGVLRRIAMTGIEYFVQRGAFGPQGLLSMGWLGPYERMRQPYSGPGSPYWSSLGLAGLVIDPQDRFWDEPEQPMPIESGDVSEAIVPAGWLVSGTRDDGIVRVINHGVDHRGETEDPLYARLSYSTATAPMSAPEQPGEADDHRPVDDRLADNQVALVAPDGTATTRLGFEQLRVGGRVAASRWGAICCWSVARGPVEVRIVRLRPGHGDDLGGHRLVITGYAIPGRPADGARDDLASPVRALLGPGTERSVQYGEDNPFGAQLRVDRVEYAPLTGGRCYAAAVSLIAGDHEPAWPAVLEVTGGVRVEWPDGSSDLITE